MFWLEVHQLEENDIETSMGRIQNLFTQKFNLLKDKNKIYLSILI